MHHRWQSEKVEVLKGIYKLASGSSPPSRVNGRLFYIYIYVCIFVTGDVHTVMLYVILILHVHSHLPTMHNILLVNPELLVMYVPVSESLLFWRAGPHTAPPRLEGGSHDEIPASRPVWPPHSPATHTGSGCGLPPVVRTPEICRA